MIITNVTGAYFLKQNDTATQIRLLISEVDGTPVDLSLATRVEVVIGVKEGRVLVKTPTLQPQVGELEFGLDEGDIVPTGDNLLEVHVYNDVLEKRVAPSKGHYKLKVQKPIDELMAEVTTYTLDYFLGEVNRITDGLPDLMERGEAVVDFMEAATGTVGDLISDANEALTSANAALENSTAAVDGANTAADAANAAANRVDTAISTADAAALNANQSALNAGSAAQAATDATASVLATTADTIIAKDAANLATQEANLARDAANLAANVAEDLADSLAGYEQPIVDFSLNVTYLKHQKVRYNGSTYSAKKETTGYPLPVAPAVENEWWSLVAQRGVDGEGAVQSVNGIMPNVNGDIVLPDNTELTKLVSHQFTVKPTANGQTTIEIPLGTFDKENDTLILFRNTTAQTPAMYSVNGKTITLVQPVVDAANTEFHILIMANVFTGGTVTSAIQEILDDFSNNLTSVDERLTKQLTHIAKVERQRVSLEQFSNLVNGDDWTEALKEGVKFSSDNGLLLVLPNEPINISHLMFSQMTNIFIEFLPNSILKPINDLESDFLVFKNCTNVEIIDYRADGENHYTRGLMFLEGNRNVKINKIDIKNISPIIKANPTNTNAVGLFIATHDNHNFDIGEVYVDGVRNNNNGIIGDALGSARGILFDTVNETQTVSCTNIRIKNAEISNIYCEDADGIQFTGTPTKHDIIVENVYTDNTERRSLKFQNIKGAKVNKLVASQTDRSFIMVAGVSMYTSGNELSNYDVDIRGYRGVEFAPTDTSDIKTVFKSGNILVTNEKNLDGNSVVPFYIREQPNVIVCNLHVENLTTKGSISGIRIWAYTRDVVIRNIEHTSYTKDQVAVQFLKLATASPDGNAIEHVNLKLENVIGEFASTYPEPGVTFDNSSFENHFSKNGVNPYSLIVYHKGIRITRNDYASDAIPTNGNYPIGTYITNSRCRILWDNNIPSSKVVKGWIRVTEGNSHILGTDWIEDRILIGNSQTGTTTYSGDGTTTTKNIPHGVSTAPRFFQVTPSSLDAGNAVIKFVTADVTNLTVTFNTAPITGTNNIKLTWKAEA